MIEENFKDVTPAARRRILCDNARCTGCRPQT